MRSSRWWYAGALAVTVACGLGSRQWSALPSWIGDLLWASMLFFGISLLAPGPPRAVRAAVAVAVCYLVEVSQLLHADWLDRLRASAVGHLALGQGFDWTDLLAYTAGVAVAALIDVAVGPAATSRASGRRQPAGDGVGDR